MLSACVAGEKTEPTREPTPTQERAQATATPLTATATAEAVLVDAVWWDEAVFYEIFVRSFYDTDGDGIGDFNGITQKLDYLQDLGITALWLMPIHPSPSYHGYDILNYYAVNPDYGTLEDFQNLLAEAHEHDIRIIIDLVLNHTSSQHPFFADANSNLESPYRDWYIWSDTNPGNGWHQGSSGYYFGYFWGGMPDLSYKNPEVTAQMDQVVRFWLEKVGVDGFRVDAAKHLIEEGTQVENTPATHAWYKTFYAAYKTEFPQAYIIGEVFGAGAFIGTTYLEQFDHLFNFELASGFLNSANGGSNSGANSAFSFTLKDMPLGGYATFLTNHDQNRAASVLNNDTNKAKVAASLLLTAPGTPFIYYGEEMGMPGKKPDEDLRLPMQWSGDPNAGFSTGAPWRAVDSGYLQVNAALQANDPASLLSHYRTLIALRHQHPALRTGATTLVKPSVSTLFASLRTSAEEQILVLINLSDEPVQAFTLSVASSPLAVGDYQLESLLGEWDAVLSVDQNGGFTLESPLAIQPYQTLILQFK